MPLIINSPVNIETGKPTGKSWKAGMQSNKSNLQENHRMQVQNSSTVVPMKALGFEELKINRISPITKDGKVKPMAALGFKHNEIGTQARWNRIQGQLDMLGQDEHTFYRLHEVYDDYCVYETEGKLFKRGFSLDDNEQVILDNNVQEVVEQVSFDELKTHVHSTKVKPMPALGFAHNKKE